ncbi:hypothetical protein [Listeria costaricensis]|uniref:hypothetical protein n=1 Tax=Listeria costaricensis TaxID=2026604 RepID=UPI001F08BD03|nr:hypothetical protein [Listeria costaricensis]
MNKLPANRWKTATIIVSALAVIIIGVLSYELYTAKSAATDMQGNMQQNGQMMPGSSDGSSSDGNGQMTPPDANSGASQDDGSTDDSTSSDESSSDDLSTSSDESL